MIAQRGAPDGPLTLLAGLCLDGTLAEPCRDVQLTIDGGIITAIAAGADAPAGANVLDLREYTVLPGLINMHTHTILPGDGTPFMDWMTLPDELLLLKAHANGLAALHSGVTTIRDCGGKGGLMFRLRDAIRAGIVAGPRFVLAGRPLTITGGHCHPFGGEADGVDGMRRAARRLIAEGADFIKIMASGGGTPGTYPNHPAFETEELRAAIGEGQKVGKPASCHCTAAEAVTRALDAGTDHIEHCYFTGADGTWREDPALARRVAEAGVYVTATMQTMEDWMLAERARTGVAPARDRHAETILSMRRLHEAGVKLVAGNDAGWRDTGFDDFSREIELLAEVGLTPLEAIHAATGRAAAACRLDGQIGTIAVGRAADLLVVAGDPTSDLTALRTPTMVLQGGDVVVDAR
jgi:imidazolonepropionase-like amidohydrolase